MAETPQDFTRAEDTVLSLSDKFAANANAKTVYGEPVHAGSRTIIPVAKIGYLLGATSAGRNGETVGGGSGGGGVGARPVGYIEITDAGSRYIELSAIKKTLVVIALGFVTGYLFRGSRNTRGDKGK